MEPPAVKERSSSCPAQLDLKVTNLSGLEEKLQRIAEEIRERPAETLLPALPPVYAAFLGKPEAGKSLDDALKWMAGPISQIPIVCQFATLPSLYLGPFSQMEEEAKELTLKAFKGSPEAQEKVIHSLKDMLKQGGGEGVALNRVVSWILDELETARISAQNKTLKKDNAVNVYLVDKMPELGRYFAPEDFKYYALNYPMKVVVNQAFSNYKIASPLLKRNMEANIQELMRCIVLCSGSCQKEGDKFAKELGTRAFEMIDRFLFETKHRMAYYHCLIKIVKKVHSKTDVSDEELKEHLIDALNNFIDDVEHNHDMKGALEAGLSKVIEMIAQTQRIVSETK